ncbi:MAG TPA: phage holin family protein [Candidatus Limnocylindrales bacterium]|nr:phage holin family protein [Candidatus Limnocylindrales bacterium]
MAAIPEGTPTGVTPDATATANGHRGVIDLARTAVEDTVRLVQLEIQLAKLEIKEMLVANLRAAIMLAGAAFCALLFLVTGLSWLALVLPHHALVAGIEALVFLVIAAMLGLLGARSLKIGPPPKTMTSLKEDAEWARHLLKRNGK